MAWFRVDDHLYSHPKWLAASKGARALWTSAGSWSAGQLLDGYVPESALRILDGTKREAEDLVRVGLWERADAGWRFHGWIDFQPTRASVVEKRRKDADRLKAWRDRKDAERDEKGA